ncbi:tachykinin-like peptides receptor 86C isoform X1 [Vespula squamosa]|uniref:Tachykinin-like peptides receptor 86C isoform X1 n=1 Tax=Vespula squamosa TaxID=30214 RepID=A0ABD2B865_VESSQ
MDNINASYVYNCTASILNRDVDLLLELNYTDFSAVFQEALEKSRENSTQSAAFSKCLGGIQEPPFKIIWWEKIIWSLIFAIILIIAVGGNLIVIWIVLAHRRMRTMTNYFLVNLSVADLLMSLFNCVFNVIFLLNSSWPFGSTYCTINNFIAHMTVGSSAFSLVIIALDRYIAIMHPLRKHLSRKRTISALILIWSLSACLAIPNLLYSTTKHKSYLNGETRITCYLTWPDGEYLDSKIGHYYDIVFFFMTYIFPIMAMAVCYTIVGRKLWDKKFIGELTTNQNEAVKAKRKVVKMFLYVLTIFAVCWFPYQGSFIFVYYYRKYLKAENIQHIYLTFYWLAMSNCMVNPILYYWMNNRFRAYFKVIICKCWFVFDRSNGTNEEMREFIELHRYDQERCHYIYRFTDV